MNRKARMPGFSAERVLEVTTQQRSYTGDWTGSSDQQAVTPQGRRGCGFGTGIAVAGCASGNLLLCLGGFLVMLGEC